MGIQLNDLREHTADDQQMPFAQALPSFPIRKRRRCVQEAIGATEASPHIPAWLPRLPQAHTWKATAALTQTEAVAKDVGKQRVAAEEALVGLHKKVPKAFGGLTVPQVRPPCQVRRTTRTTLIPYCVARLVSRLARTPQRRAATRTHSFSPRA